MNDEGRRLIWTRIALAGLIVAGILVIGLFEVLLGRELTTRDYVLLGIAGGALIAAVAFRGVTTQKGG